MFTKRILPWLLLACLLLCTVVVAVAEQDDEEVTIVIYDADGNAVTGGGEDGTEPIATPTLAPEPTVDPTLPVYEADGSILLTMSFTGDVTIGSNTQSGGKSIFDKELENNGGDINFPFKNTRAIFLADDVTMVNFEGTLTTAGKNREKLENSFLFRADPSFVTMLPNGGVDTVSLENNHVLDMGEDGLAETKKTLLDAGITYASEGEPAIFTVKGVTIGSTVVVERLDNGAKTEFALVGSQEANHKAKPMRLSDESPFGKAVMGHKAGDRVQVEVSPTMKYFVEIRSIEKGTDDESLDISSY